MDMPKNPRVRQNAVTAYKMHDSGMSVPDICNALKYSPATINRYLRWGKILVIMEDMRTYYENKEAP